MLGSTELSTTALVMSWTIIQWKFWLYQMWRLCQIICWPNVFNVLLLQKIVYFILHRLVMNSLLLYTCIPFIWKLISSIQKCDKNLFQVSSRVCIWAKISWLARKAICSLCLFSFNVSRILHFPVEGISMKSQLCPSAESLQCYSKFPTNTYSAVQSFSNSNKTKISCSLCKWIS